MTDLKRHFAQRSATGLNLLASRVSKHPERYVEIFRVFRKYELHHIVAELGMSHQHEDDEDHAEVEHEDDHGIQLASALEELGPCFIKLGQLLSTRPDLLPADYIHALLTDDGRLALMDFGMVGRFDAGQKAKMIQQPRDLDQHSFTQDISALVSRYHDMSGGRLGLGTALLDLTRLAYQNRVPVPTSMTLLGKTMLNLDGAIGVLSQELDPVELIRNYMLDVMLKRVGDQLSPGRVFAWVLDMKHLFENAPRRTDAILGKLADGRLTLRLDLDHLDEATDRLSGAATRLAVGVLAGSLLMGGGQVLSALIRTGAVGGRHNGRQ